MPDLDIAVFAALHIIKAAVLSARWAGLKRTSNLKAISLMNADEKDKELAFLREEVLKYKERERVWRQQMKRLDGKYPYPLDERLSIIFFMEAFGVAKSKVTEYFGVAVSTYYRWLHKIDDVDRTGRTAHNKTPDAIVDLVWEMASQTYKVGRKRIANQLGQIGVFLSDSTVRNILNRPRPPRNSTTVSFEVDDELVKKVDGKSIPAFYPNHVWSLDMTIVKCFGIWKTYVLVASLPWASAASPSGSTRM